MAQLGTGVIVFISLLLLVLVILWIVLPFAVFGIKRRQDASHELLVKIDRNLKALVGMQQRLAEQQARALDLQESELKLRAIQRKAALAQAAKKEQIDNPS